MDDNEFAQKFLAEAKKRQAKLADIETLTRSHQPTEPKVSARGLHSPMKQQHSNFNNNTYSVDQSGDDQDVSYPPLSPLPEESDVAEETDVEDITLRNLGRYRQSTMTDLHGESETTSQISDMNYSPDLSLDCDEVYRAEPVLCHSSPQCVEPKRRYSINSRDIHPTAPLKDIGQQQQQHKNHQNYHFTEPQKQPKTQQAQHAHVLQQPERKTAATSSHSLPTSFSDKHVIDDMRARADRTNQTRIQLKKAVEISKHGSKEHIEAARLLQITENEHLAFNHRASKLELGEYKRPESAGSLKLSGLELRMSSKLRNELADDSISHYFLCIATCGIDVKATEVVDTNSIRKQDIKAYIRFQEELSFENLPPDFNVKLEVFELVIGPNLPKFLTRLTPSKKSRVATEVTFKRVGSLKLTLADRKETYKKLTQFSSSEQSKYVESECKFRIELKSEQLPTKSGMLYVRTLDSGGKPYWSRFWVKLSGSQLKFWKSKQDSVDGKLPCDSLEIGDFCSETTHKLTPNDNLYRQHSFVLYTIQEVSSGDSDTFFQRILEDQPNLKMIRHQLAADSKEDRDAWCACLDKSMSCFREWHGKAKIFSSKDVNEIFSY